MWTWSAKFSIRQALYPYGIIKVRAVFPVNRYDFERTEVASPSQFVLGNRTG